MSKAPRTRIYSRRSKLVVGGLGLREDLLSRFTQSVWEPLLKGLSVPEKIKLAVIGCGNITRAHLEDGLKRFEDVVFVGWCDVQQKNAWACRALVGDRGEVFTDPDKMLVSTKPDAVYIMLPPFAHGETEQAVLAHKKPFFMEKPVALDLRLARRVAKQVRAKRLINSVGYMNRYRYGVQQVRDMLRDRSSKLVFMHGGWIGNLDSGPRWLLDKSTSGGQVIEQSTHTVDLFRHLGGEVADVYAAPIKKRKKRPKWFTVEDASLVTIRFQNGAAATLYSSWSTPHGGIQLNVHATDFAAHFTGWNHDCRIHHGPETITIEPEANIFRIEDRAFIDAVKSGDRSHILANYDDGVAALAIATAVNESMRTGKPAKV